LCTARHPLTKIAVKKAGCKRLTGMAAGGINRTFLTGCEADADENPSGRRTFLNAEAGFSSQGSVTAECYPVRAASACAGCLDSGT
jgi:hypothetical protein